MPSQCFPTRHALIQNADSIAAVIGVAGAGFRLSLILNAVSCEVASEGLEVHSISKTVTLFSITLKQTGLALQNHDSVHTPEALDGIQRIADDATRIFDEFNEMLDRVRTKPKDAATGPSIQQRFQWCFKRHRVTYLLAELDTHKLSLSVIQQVLQLGKLMASTSKHDPQDEVAMKQELIKQERVETQNILIVRYWQMNKIDRLYEASRQEDEADRIAATEHHDNELALVSSAGSSQLTIEAPPPEYTTSLALVKLETYSLGDVDQTLHKIRESPKDMVHVSSEAIDPLLDRWTRWYEARERRNQRHSGGRYAPSVDEVYEDDDGRQYYRDYREREDSPKGYYLEGNTTDWRQPHSHTARREAVQRRQKYSRYQPSVSAASSDVDDSPGSTASNKKKTPKHHIIDSDSESSDSDHDQPRIRVNRTSNGGMSEKKPPVPDGQPLPYPYNASQHGPRKTATIPPVSTGRGLAPSPHLSQHRPNASPVQYVQHHSVSSPMPPIHTANALNPYNTQPAGPPSYAPYYPTPQQYSSSAHARYAPPGSMPARMAAQPRPLSSDGKGGRSPSRPLYQPVPAPQRSFSTPKQTEEEKKIQRERTKKNLREGATKGLLGAGAIAGFLEALEGLSI